MLATCVFRMSSMAYACVGTSPARSAFLSDMMPVATVIRQWPWWNRSNILLNSRSGLKSSLGKNDFELSTFCWTRWMATLSGIHPVRACKSIFYRQRIATTLANYWSTNNNTKNKTFQAVTRRFMTNPVIPLVRRWIICTRLCGNDSGNMPEAALQ